MKSDNPNSIESIITGLELLCKALDGLPKVLESIVTAFRQIDWDAIARLPDNIKQAGETWASYGWVPFLPAFEMNEYIDSLIAPSSQQEADQIMMNYFNENPPAELFSELKQYVIKNGHNASTYDEAVKCFDCELYTSCALDLFAMLDSVFVYGQQKKHGARKRDLSRGAVKRLYREDECGYLINAIATNSVILTLFKDGNDFSIQETGLNRNFVSHGMNKYIPTKLDCLKMFVLLYNTYILFEEGLFHWEEETTK